MRDIKINIIQTHSQLIKNTCILITIFLNQISIMRHLTLLDHVLGQMDTALRTICPPQQRTSARPTPGADLSESSMTNEERRHVAGLMRVNHSGEVCAQALYQGQATTAKLEKIKTQMQAAADEEIDHLAWCEQRLTELNSCPSKLNPIWYLGSFILGACAGLVGDRWSLGFVAETERQVTGHLNKHQQKIPQHDLKTAAILVKMSEDESLHAESAVAAGAAELPLIVRELMRSVSKLLTFSSYYV